MIKKMNKYSIILLSSDLDTFLNSVQELGLVDITRSKRAIDTKSKELMELSFRYRMAIKSIKSLPKEKSQKQIDKKLIPEGELLSTIEQSLARKEEINQLITIKQRELEEGRVWGDYHKEDIDKIEQIGYSLHFYSIVEKKFDKNWENEYPLTILNKTNDRIYFTILVPKDEQFDFSIQESKFPDTPISTIENNLVTLNSELESLIFLVSSFSQYIDKLEILKGEIDSSLDYYLADASTKYEGEESIATLEGFALVDDSKRIDDFLNDSEAYYIEEAAKGEDNPPVKLKNNFFTRAFEVIGDFYMLPKYDELDLTPFFAPFYMLFFGFCLGDMGYGLILLIVGLIATFAIPKFKKYGILVTYLGIGTIIMPALTGTFFGAKLYELFDLPKFIDDLFFSDMKLFWFGILFGLFHIIFARVVRGIYCFTKKMWNEGITCFGWSILIVWATLAYAGMEMDKTFISPIVSKILLFGSIGLILFFSKPTKNIFLRPIMGITSLYDITGVFGDMLSYIRLFGLATAGGILGMVVNSVAMQMSSIPYLGWVLAIIMLIVGHMAVMALSALGAFVHPMRLTFVEFYKNANFTGGGRAFNPLKKSVNNNNNKN